jgi:hypothetical protein
LVKVDTGSDTSSHRLAPARRRLEPPSHCSGSSALGKRLDAFHDLRARNRPVLFDDQLDHYCRVTFRTGRIGDLGIALRDWRHQLWRLLGSRHYTRRQHR